MTTPPKPSFVKKTLGHMRRLTKPNRHSIYLVGGLWVLASLVMSLFFHNTQTLFNAGTWLLFVLAAVVNIFVIIYAQRRWRSNVYGRAMMYATASLAAVVDIVFMTTIFGRDWTWRYDVRFLFFGGVLIAYLRLLYVLVRMPDHEDEGDDD